MTTTGTTAPLKEQALDAETAATIRAWSTADTELAHSQADDIDWATSTDDASRTLLHGSVVRESGLSTDLTLCHRQAAIEASGFERERSHTSSGHLGLTVQGHGALPHDSARPSVLSRVLIITLSLAFASGISPSLCMAQPAGGPLLDRWEARFDRAEKHVEDLTAATDRHSTALTAVGDNVKEAIEAAKALGVGAFWLVVLAICGALTYKVLDIVKAGMVIFATREKT